MHRNRCKRTNTQKKCTRRNAASTPRKYNEGQPNDLSNEALGRGVRYYTPILDHLFSSTITFSNKEKAFSVRDGNFVSGADQQGNPLTLSPPVATVVDCSEQETVCLLLRGYRSVSE
eukprot:scaffold114530_cov56-Attheya_sp.AAC.1